MYCSTWRVAFFVHQQIPKDQMSMLLHTVFVGVNLTSTVLQGANAEQGLKAERFI
jgi:hypothetical protein